MDENPEYRPWVGPVAVRRRPVPNKPRADSPAERFPGSDVSADELAFLRAIDAYQRRWNRKFLTWTEVLAIVHALGYRRVEPSGAVCPPSETSPPVS